MSTDEEREKAQVVLVALGDQIQALVQRSPVEIAAVVIFSQAGPVEYRSPHPRELIVEHMRRAADELEKPE